MAEPMRRRARYFARDHRMIRRGQRRRGRHRDLELARAILRQEQIRGDAGGAQPSHETLAEHALASERAEAVPHRPAARRSQ